MKQILSRALSAVKATAKAAWSSLKYALRAGASRALSTPSIEMAMEGCHRIRVARRRDVRVAERVRAATQGTLYVLLASGLWQATTLAHFVDAFLAAFVLDFHEQISLQLERLKPFDEDSAGRVQIAAAGAG